MLSGFLFLSWRIFEIVILIPIVGMLSYFVHGYVESNQLTPTFILVLFIVSVLALAWAVGTLISYLRARHDAIFVALIDLGIVGGLIAGVYELRSISNANCANFTAGSLYVSLGEFGYVGKQSNSHWALHVDKTCAMLKASFALAIIAILAFFITFLLALLVARNHRNDDKVVVKREYHSSRHGHRRSTSRSRRSNDNYYARPSSGSRRQYRSSSRSRYVV